MASFTAGTTFVDGVANDVTAAKLGALVTNATPTSGLIQDRTAETVVATNDTFLIGDASDSNTLKRMTVANVMKAELTGTINTTAGTITTLNSTTGTITGLNTTTGTIANISATTSTFLGTITGSTNVVNIGSGQIYKDASGNVGVGTTSIAAKLHVYSASASDKLVRFGPGGISDGNFITTAKNGVAGATDGTPQFSLGMDYSTTYTDLAAIKFARGVGAQGNILFHTGSAANGTERLRIDESGNVGIGVTNPATKLDVNGPLQLRANGTEGGELGLLNPDNATTGLVVDVASANNGRIFSTNNNFNLSLGQLGGAGGNVLLYTEGAERLRIDEIGNVGIGVSAPVNKLEIVGSFGRGAPVTKTADFTLAATENWIIVNKATTSCTATLPAASSWTGREFTIKTLQALTVVSASANVVPINGTTAGTAILPAASGSWAKLVSNGTNWVIMAS